MNFETVLGVALLISIAAVIPALPLVLVMHCLMPRAVLDRYWREPYFRPFEIGLFTNTLLAPMRTVMLTWVIAFPRFGKKRNIVDAGNSAPKWYRLAAMAINVWILGWTALILALTLIFFIYYDVLGNPMR